MYIKLIFLNFIIDVPLNFYLVCIDCEVAWADWSDCVDGERVRFQYISVRNEGAGRECPELQSDREGICSFNLTSIHKSFWFQ